MNPQRTLPPMFCSMLVIMLIACGGGDDDSGPNPHAVLAMGELCAVDYANDCPERTCADVVSGESSMGGTGYRWDQASIEGTICTRKCSGDDECTGIDFASANEHAVASQHWSCSGGLCRVHVTDVGGDGGDLCSGCGGVFCSGDCIGCPQCR